jgi:hypothetical protein
MPATVRLDFIRPDIPGLVALHIYEASAPDGTFTEIERVTAIGTYPNYISEYTTTAASSVDDYFTTAWEHAGGSVTPQSAPVKGNTTALVVQIVNRMMLRDPSLDEVIAGQEAEAAISDYYNVLDPYSVDPTTVSPQKMSGLTNLALARAYLSRTITSSQANKWAAGIVSMDTSSGSSQSTDTIKKLIDLANYDLGLNYSIVLLMQEVEVAGGYKRLVAADLSRSIIEVQ